ncbi:MAG: hypothetical protein LBP89_02720 [Helicobacteraceae bacterium]|jgi:hypothetical protein|nr:hypothetical protein [Helicobacteraceae bacterium]
MGYFRELIENTSVTNANRLQTRYFWLNAAIRLAAVFACIALILPVVTELLATWLDVSMRDAVVEQPNGLIWIALFLASIPLLFYAAAVIVALSTGIAMALFGALSFAEVIPYALLSRYPDRWLKPNAKNKGSGRKEKRSN